MKKELQSQRGSILLLVMFTLSLLVAAALSSTQSLDARMDDARGQADNTRNQLLAESMVDFAASQLKDNVNYVGTGEQSLSVGGSTVTITAAPTPGTPDGNPYSVIAEAASGEGKAKMQADLTVHSGIGADADLAMIFLGDEFHLLDSTVLGDTLIADAPGAVRYWIIDEHGVGSWQGNDPQTEDYEFEDSAVVGDLFHYSGTNYGVATEEHHMNSPIHAPIFDLDQYLVPGPDKIIYWYENNLRNVSHEETAVFVMHENHTLSLDRCDFPGGIVVYVEKDWDVRAEACRRNKVILKHGTTVGGGTGGVHPNLGMIAPGTEIQFTHPGCIGQEDHNDVEGFILWNAVHMIKEARIRGMVIVYREVKHFRRSEVVFDPNVLANLPPGIEFSLPYASVEVGQVREYYQP